MGDGGLKVAAKQWSWDFPFRSGLVGGWVPGSMCFGVGFPYGVVGVVWLCWFDVRLGGWWWSLKRFWVTPLRFNELFVCMCVYCVLLARYVQHPQQRCVEQSAPLQAGGFDYSCAASDG